MLKAVVPSQAVKLSVSYFPRKTATTLAARAVSTDENVLPFSKVPRIPALPFIGNAWIYLPVIGKYDFKKLHKANLQKYYDYGPIHIDAFSKQLQFLNVYDPDDIAKVYRSEGKFPERFPLKVLTKYRSDKRDLYNNGGLLTTLGKEWWDVRTASQPHMMKPKSVYAYLSAMDEVADAFTNRMAHLRGKDGGEVPDYLQELFKWSLESVALVAFDTRLGGLDVKPNQDAVNMINAVNTAFDCVLKLEFSGVNLWQKFPSYTYRKFEKQMDYFSGKVLQYLAEAKQRLVETPEDHEPTFLELMIKTSKDPRDLTAMLTDMVFGGIDTTSCTVGYTLYHLARNPDAQDKLYQEITSKVSGPLSVEALNELTYMKACVKESMRLHPVAIGNSRTLAEDTVLSGYAIPAGTKVFIQGYTIGHLEKYFPEPEKFKPERFLRSESTHHPFAFLPFGFGPRMCIGQRIAQQEIWTLLTKIIQRYRVEYHHEDIDMVLKGVAVPDKPLRFQFYDR